MKNWDVVAIIGVGLIGGSIGRALKKRALAGEVVGVGRNLDSLRIAKDCGAIDRASIDWRDGLVDAELVVVCTPVERIVDHVRRAAKYCRAGTLITDAGSTKQRICEALCELPPDPTVFVGSHPMAGGAQQGPAASDPDLFEGRPTIVTPAADAAAPQVERVKHFWQSLGSAVTTMAPADHDRAVAAISHLPHLTASVLAAVTPNEYLPLASTGWGDSTRVASGDVDLWRQILSDNRPRVLQALDSYCQSLATVRQALEDDDIESMIAVLTEGKKKRDALGS